MLTFATNEAHKTEFCARPINPLAFASTSTAAQTQRTKESPKWLRPTSRNSPKVQTLMKNLTVLERAQIGAAAGGIAGAFTYVCLHPLDTIKTKTQTKGYSATLLRNLPAGVLSYSSFEYLKAAVLSRIKKNHLDPIQSVFCGALAGAISASITTPLDVFKTRLMTQVHGEAVNKVATTMYSGVSATVRQILKEEGWIGLTRGMGPRVLHSACFSTWDTLHLNQLGLQYCTNILSERSLMELLFLLAELIASAVF